MSSTANARFDGLIILPRPPPKSLGPFFAKVITLRLRLVPSLSFVALFLIVWHASVLPSKHHSTALIDRMPDHLPEDIHFSTLQSVHDTDLSYDNTLLAPTHSLRTSPSQLKTYHYCSIYRLFNHCLVLAHPLRVLPYATCTTLDIILTSMFTTSFRFYT